MKIEIPVNNNFYEENPIIGEKELYSKFGIQNNAERTIIKKLFSSVFELTKESEDFNYIKLYNFRKTRKQNSNNNKDKLILKLYSKNGSYFLQTGLYAGIIYHQGCKFNITTRYGETFLTRMLNFVNDVYVNTEKEKGEKREIENYFLFIIGHLFIQSLERSTVLGFPRKYVQHHERSLKFRGSVDIKKYLRNDIPFLGKLTTKFREQMYSQEIIDVIYYALRKVESQFNQNVHARLLGVRKVLKQNYSGKALSREVIEKAKSDKALQNSMYYEFKQILEYSEIILLNKDFDFNQKRDSKTVNGYLFDIAELYEIYLEKLLRKNFPEWIVEGQTKIRIYQNQFFGRNIYPDIKMVHKKTNKVIILDAKFKKMSMKNKDVDIEDIHQIHSYAGYYQDNLIVTGLIYPISEEHESEKFDVIKSHSSSLYGSNKHEAHLLVDGIFVKENQTMGDLIKRENEFVERISNVINLYMD